MTPILKLNSVTKSYVKCDTVKDKLRFLVNPKDPNIHHTIFEDVTFQLNRGDTLGIIGRNGAGKSTLLKTILGIVSPSYGDIEVVGRVMSLIELGTGFIGELSGEENIFLVGALSGASDYEIKESYKKILEFSELGAKIKEKVRTYSSGMLARLGFSVASMLSPQLIIIDEVLAVGDARFQKKCISRIRDLRADGAAIVIVSHDEYQITNNCANCLYLQTPQSWHFGPSKNIFPIYQEDLFEISENFDQNIHSLKHSLSIHDSLLSLTFSTRNVNEYSLAFNIYSADGSYVYGASSLDSGCRYYCGATDHKIQVDLSALNRGTYSVRIAINDKDGHHTIAEANPLFSFKIQNDSLTFGVLRTSISWE